jgi:hypothetical protein
VLDLELSKCSDDHLIALHYTNVARAGYDSKFYHGHFELCLDRALDRILTVFSFYLEVPLELTKAGLELESQSFRS